MIVMKFGGTSVGKPERMKEVAKLIQHPGQVFVVLSALSGTTNALVKIGNFLYNFNRSSARKEVRDLTAHYEAFIDQLYSTENGKKHGLEVVREHFDFINGLVEGRNFSLRDEKVLLAQGELMSTKLFHAYLDEIGLDSVLLPALEFMRIDEDGEPMYKYAADRLKTLMADTGNQKLYVTQGYICTNMDDQIDNLKRGGSDYTASLIGAAIKADEIQIWTDIDGIHNNDPRIVSNTRPVPEISFTEAAELAYFGAKILHPQSVLPALTYNIPVRLLNTMQPDAKGTLISNNINSPAGQVKAVAAKDGITAIKIRSSRMLLAYGFLRQVFEIFEKYKTPIDMITTSEVAVSLSIDNDTFLNEIVRELEEYGNVQIDHNQTIICIVGDMVEGKKDVMKKVFDAMNHIPIRMISYGGSHYNISLLIPTEHKVEALTQLNHGLFDL